MMHAPQPPHTSAITHIAMVMLYSVLCAALFGALHDQLSYSVSPEYFTLLKFQQFHLTEWALPLRLKAALVGVLATWWVGLPLGLALGLATRRWYGAQAQAVFWRLLPWLLLAVSGGALLGLGYGYWQTNELHQFAGKRLPFGLQDVRGYLMVGIMHKAAYLAAGLVLPFALLLLYWRRPR